MVKVTRSIAYALSIGLLVAALLMILNRQAVADWWVLRGYVPTPEIAQLASDTTMTDSGRNLFYIHDPELLAKEDFTGKCDIGEATIVLGCYITDTKIYVFDVDNEQLEGIEQVTAAHEMLHAVYDRLDEDERNKINAMLLDVYAESTDERLRRTIQSYRERDSSIVPNELHSILPTEVRDLPPELEEYYAQYFTDRSVVVSYAENYEESFVALETRIETLDTQLNTLNEQIRALEVSVLSQQGTLASEKAALEALRSNASAYNAQIPAYNNLVRVYNSDLELLRAQISQYNTIVEERNAIALEEQELVDAIDTRATEL